MNQKIRVCAFFAVVLAGSCSSENKQALNTTPTTGCDTTNVTFKGTIQSLNNQYCAISGCHTTSALASGYDFSSYADVKRAADNGSLLGSIRHDPQFSPMPRGTNDKLSDCEIAKYAKWVADGAPNN